MRRMWIHYLSSIGTDVKNANLMRGAYHFYYTKDSPSKQADFFISTVFPTSEKSDLPPVIDIETDGVNSDITVEQLQKDIQIFLSIVQSKFNRRPILYTSYDFCLKSISTIRYSATIIYGLQNMKEKHL